MSDYQITLAAHTGGLRDEVKDHSVNRLEFKRITGHEFVQIGMTVYQRYELGEHHAVYLSIHPLRISITE